MNFKAFKRLFSYLKNHKARFIAAVIATVFGTAFTVIAPTLLGNITTTLSYGVTDGIWISTEGVAPEHVCSIFGTEVNKMVYIIFIIVALTVLYVASFLISGFANNSFARITSLIVKDMRNDIEEKMHKLSLNYFDTHLNGDVLSVITNDVDALSTSLQNSITLAVQAVVTLVGVIIAMFISEWHMALVVLISLPIILIAIFVILAIIKAIMAFT